MISVGINGFGRIGKCLFLQLIENTNFTIKCLNAIGLSVNEISDYLLYDTTHKHNISIDVKIIDEHTFRINHHTVKLVSERDAKKMDWTQMECEYLFDATGAYLTSEKCKDHNVPYVIMSSPAKDKTNTFIYGTNHETYNGENVVSGSSCTTNCIAPLLKVLNDHYKINNCIFTTIHATTASQYVVDVLKPSARTNRSIFNNIIPHTTGASSSIISVLPELKGKINGTSLRVPVVNCSLVDVNIELRDTSVTLKDIQELLMNHPLYKVVYDVSVKKLVSCDFTTTTTPTILDINASIDIGNGKFKLMVWYDNEWSYSAQLIRFVQHMYTFNHTIKDKFYMENLVVENKGVVCRLDYNVPMNKSNEIVDDFRIVSTIPTIQCILNKNPKYIVLVSHFGRPKGWDKKLSLEFLIPVLEDNLDHSIIFLKNGLSQETLTEIRDRESKMEVGAAGTGINIYLLENVRFHKEETDYENGLNDQSVVNIYKELGDVFVCDAFGCVHRKHLSIYAMKYFNKPYGYGPLIKKELTMINTLTNSYSSNKKILGIIGGNKISDKLPIIQSLKQIPYSDVYIAGGLAKQYKVIESNEHVMIDGYGSNSLDGIPQYIDNIDNNFHSINPLNVYDIGDNSLQWLKHYINNADTIFWNGSLGVIEHTEYKKGSIEILNYLFQQEHKTVIIGGGETASLILNKTQNCHVYVSTGGGALLEYLQNKILYNRLIVGLEIYV